MDCVVKNPKENNMSSANLPSFNRVVSVEDGFVPLKVSPFADDDNSTSVPAVAVDWDSKQLAFNVTLLSIRDGEERLWSDSFSISKIRRRHYELCLVHPELKSSIPRLPRDPQGW